MDRITQLATKFRNAIEAAHKSGEFRGDIVFRNFPLGCCGDVSDLLSEYLKRNSINTLYVCGTYYGDCERMQSHAWLIADEIIIDITWDQFKYDSTFMKNDVPVYVGNENDFYKLFEVEERDIRKGMGVKQGDGTCNSRLVGLYNIINEYL